MLIYFHLNLNLQIDNKNFHQWPDSELFGLNFGIKKMIPESRIPKKLINKLKTIHLFFQIQQKSRHKNYNNNNFQFFIMLVKKIRYKKLLIIK